MYFEDSPLDGIETHKYYNDAYKSYMIVGHPTSLTTVMQMKLADQISRNIITLITFLIFSVACLFFFFAWFFEKQL